MGTAFRYLQLLVIAGSLSLVACKDGGGSPDSGLSDLSSLNALGKPILYDEATAVEFSDYVLECNGSGKPCVLICHIPPGNPDDRHDKVLPLKASLAHMGHGDILGDCEEHPEYNPDQSDGDSGSGDEAGPSDEAEGDSDIPQWCQDMLDIDSDCDGVNDETGDPIF